MSRKCVIGAGPLFSLLLVSSLIIMITVNSTWTGGGDFLDGVISCAIAFAANFIAVIPLGLLYRRKPTMNILDHGYYLTGWFGGVLALFYGFYFLTVDCYYLSVFQVFNANMIDPEMPSWLIVIAVLAAAVYAAWKGVESITRASVFILVMLLAGLAFILLTSIAQVKPENFKPVLYNGWEQTIRSTMLFLGRSTGLATLAVVLPVTKGGKKTGFAVWNIVTYVLMSAIIVIMVGVLGNALQIQMFPMHTLAAVSGIGPFQRMDSVFLGIWLLGVFIKIAVDLYLFGSCMQRVFRIRRGGFFIIGGALAVGAVSVLITKSVALQHLFFDIYLLAPLTLLASFVIPLVLLLIDTLKSKNKSIRLMEETLEVQNENRALD